VNPSCPTLLQLLGRPRPRFRIGATDPSERFQNAQGQEPDVVSRPRIFVLGLLVDRILDDRKTFPADPSQRRASPPIAVKATASRLTALGPDGLTLTAPVGSADRLGMPAAPGVREQARHVHTTDTRGRHGRSDEIACEARHVAPQRADHDRRLTHDRSRCIGTQELAPTLTTVTSTAASGRWLTIDRTLDATRARPQRVQAQPESASARTSANTTEHALFDAARRDCEP
jgi:hypothetical protein